MTAATGKGSKLAAAMLPRLEEVREGDEGLPPGRGFGDCPDEPALRLANGVEATNGQVEAGRCNLSANRRLVADHPAVGQHERHRNQGQNPK